MRLGWMAHLAFAGYHMLVLMSLLKSVWLGVGFVVLVGASACWTVLEDQRGRFVPYVTHAAADTSIILAAFLRVLLG